MNKKLNAVALANKALTRENVELWDKVELLERGCEELKALNEAMVMQLVQQAGGEVTLPKADVTGMMAQYGLEAERSEDGLRLRVRSKHDGEARLSRR